MPKLFSILSQQQKLMAQDKEIQQLQRDVEKLKKQNESMRLGMRRCVSCNYRIDFKKQCTEEID